MTLDEKEKAYSAYVEKIAKDQGMVFVIDSGEGRDLLTEDMYIEDISGWLSPKDIPEEQRKDSKYYCFAEWEQVGEAIKVSFVKYDTDF